MNDALRRLHGRKSLDDEGQQLGVEAALVTNILHETESEALEDTGSGANNHGSDFLLEIPHLELNALPLDSDTPNGVGVADIPVEAVPNGEELAEMKGPAQEGTVVQQPGHLWDVPGSPAPEEYHEHISYTGQAQPTTKKRGRPRKHYPRLRDETDKDYHTRIARLRKKPIPTVLDHNTHPLPQSSPVLEDTNHQATPKVDVQLKAEPANHSALAANRAENGAEEGSVDEPRSALGRENNQTQNDLIGHNNDDRTGSDAGETSDTLSDFIEGFDSDIETCDDMNRSSQDSFDYDVKTFGTRQTSHPEESEAFDSPIDDDVLAVRLDHQPLKQLWEVLGDEAWAGVKRDWQWRSFHYEHAETKPARALLPLLTKLERLYQAAPPAPKFKEQNQFLREHADMLRYYSYKIKLVVEHIRTKRLEISQDALENPNIDTHKRKRMTRDLVSYILPMLAHVLASAWRLGGKTWTKPSFTGTAVELLKRIVGWIMALHHRLLSELERSPFEGRPEYRLEQEAWLKAKDQKKNISLVLDNLYEVISAAPDQLAEEEARIKAETERRQQLLRREKELEIKRKAAEEARKVFAAERKKQSLLSIRAMHHHRDTPTTSSRPSPSPTLKSPEWSVEERRLLFLRIQDAFPVCPDLNDLHWELNKTMAQTLAMTEQILGKMLKKVLKGYSAEERAAELHRIMHNSDAERV